MPVVIAAFTLGPEIQSFRLISPNLSRGARSVIFKQADYALYGNDTRRPDTQRGTGESARGVLHK